MSVSRGILTVVGVALLSLSARAAEPAPEAKTLMTERGKLLFSDDFNQALSKDWKTAKGKWEIVDGVLKASEVKEDNHAAASRHPLPLENFIIQYSFKLDGAKATSLSINDEKGHCCRLAINPAGFSVNKDSHDKNVADKAAVLDKVAKPIKPGEWHTVVLEIQGKEILARLDGDVVAYGANDSIAVKKANFGLTVSGESVWFKDLRVWEASPAKDWEAIKAKLLEGRAKNSK